MPLLKSVICFGKLNDSVLVRACTVRPESADPVRLARVPLDGHRAVRAGWSSASSP